MVLMFRHYQQFEINHYDDKDFSQIVMNKEEKRRR